MRQHVESTIVSQKQVYRYTLYIDILAMVFAWQVNRRMTPPTKVMQIGDALLYNTVRVMKNTRFVAEERIPNFTCFGYLSCTEGLVWRCRVTGVGGIFLVVVC